MQLQVTSSALRLGAVRPSPASLLQHTQQARAAVRCQDSGWMTSRWQSGPRHNAPLAAACAVGSLVHLLSTRRSAGSKSSSSSSSRASTSRRAASESPTAGGKDKEEGSSAAATEAEAPGHPPHWVRIHTAAESAELAGKLSAVIATFSADLPVARAKVRSFRQSSSTSEGSVNVEEVDMWMLSMWIPPKTLLLVSSLIGETHEDAVDAPIFVENLDLDGDAPPEYVLARLPTGGDDDAADGNPDAVSPEVLAQEVVAKGLAGSVEVADGQEGSAIQFVTTAAGKEAILELLPSLGYSPSGLSWAPIGGSSEYLQWVSTKVAAEPLKT